MNPIHKLWVTRWLCAGIALAFQIFAFIPSHGPQTQTMNDDVLTNLCCFWTVLISSILIGSDLGFSNILNTLNTQLKSTISTIVGSERMHVCYMLDVKNKLYSAWPPSCHPARAYLRRLGSTTPLDYCAQQIKHATRFCWCSQLPLICTLLYSFILLRFQTMLARGIREALSNFRQ